MSTIYQTKAEALATEQRIRGIVTSAYLGIATTSTTPPPTGAYWYRVDAPGTYMGVTVTATDFKDANGNYFDVTIEVNNGVSKKILVSKPVVALKQTIDGSNTTEAVTGQAVSNYVTDYVDVYVEDKKYGENLISNPSFTKGFTSWEKNQGFPVIIENGIAKMNALSGFTDPAIFQSNRPVVNGRNYIAILKVKNLGPTSNNFRVGISTHKVLFTIENSSEFKTYVVKFSKDTDDSNQLIVFGNPSGFNVELESFYVIDETNPLYGALIQPSETVRIDSEIVAIKNNITSHTTRLDTQDSFNTTITNTLNGFNNNFK